MSKKSKKLPFYSLFEMVAGVLDPVLRRRTGLNMELIEHWSQIVGDDIGKYTVPLKIIWKSRIDQDEMFSPATLIIVCEGFTALKLMHETRELIQKINSFFGYVAIDSIKIKQTQTAISPDKLRINLSPTQKDKKRINKILENIEDESLRRSLYELGCCIFAEKSNK